MTQINLPVTQTQTQRTGWWWPRGLGGRNGSLGLADANGYTGWASNKILLHSTGDHIQYPAINCKEKGIRKNVYMTESLLI